MNPWEAEAVVRLASEADLMMSQGTFWHIGVQEMYARLKGDNVSDNERNNKDKSSNFLYKEKQVFKQKSINRL